MNRVVKFIPLIALLAACGCGKPLDSNSDPALSEDPTIRKILGGMELKALPVFDLERVKEIARSPECARILAVKGDYQVEAISEFGIEIRWNSGDSEQSLKVSGIQRPVTENETLAYLKEQYAMNRMVDTQKIDPFTDGALGYWTPDFGHVKVWTKYQSFTLARQPSSGSPNGKEVLVQLAKFFLQELEKPADPEGGV